MMNQETDESEWCRINKGLSTDFGSIKKPGNGIFVKSKKIRCPECGRRLIAKLVDWEYPYYDPILHYMLPRHKKKIKKKKMKGRKINKGRQR